MQFTYKYRLLRKATWGIAINLVAEFGSLQAGVTGPDEITPELWLYVDPALGLSKEQGFFIKLGLRIVANPIKMSNRVTGPVLVHVNHVEYNSTDFQPEGLTDAIAGWASQAFRFAKPDFAAEFDQKRHRYSFAFEPWTDATQGMEGRDAPALRTVAINRLESARALLRQDKLSPAAECAGTGVRLALKALADKSVPHEAWAQAEGASDLETVMTLLLHGTRVKSLPFRIERDITRVRTWYPDFRLEQNVSSKREVEEFVASADRIVSWANAEGQA